MLYCIISCDIYVYTVYIMHISISISMYRHVYMLCLYMLTMCMGRHRILKARFIAIPKLCWSMTKDSKDHPFPRNKPSRK